MKKKKLKLMFSQIIEEINALREEVAELRVALQEAQTEGEAPEAGSDEDAHDGSAAAEEPAPDPDAVSQAAAEDSINED